MTGILIAGTSSDAGKSLVVTGLCRALHRRGLRVAPFKAQNMSNNSMVCADGSEIGRAQYLQAIAARVEPTSAMNPVLLKPGTDRRSFVVVRGRPAGTLESGEYATGRAHLREAAFAAYAELEADYDVIVCEGAGSPAEINLRGGDYVNLGLARRFGLPVVLVGDIDRGGMLAAIFGTWGILPEDDRASLAAYVVNKFRGDVEVLRPGLEELSRLTGLPSLGVLPWLPGVWLDGEDAFDVARWRHESTAAGAPHSDRRDTLTVAVVNLPRISNATDVDALAYEEGVDVVVTEDPRRVLEADLAILPGTRSTLDDLEWLRSTGIADAIVARAGAGRPVLGICGGYQMLGGRIIDEAGIETSAGTVVDALGLLPVDTAFHVEKVLGRPSGSWAGHRVTGYEIHHGLCRLTPTVEGAPGGDALDAFLDGWRQGAVWGTLWHGAFENDDFRRAWLTEIARASGSTWRAAAVASEGSGYASRREAMIDRLADAIEEHVDLTALLGLLRPGDPVDHADHDDHDDEAVDLHHHGDRDTGPGLVDLAVNVRPARTPDFLVEAVVREADWAAYPDARGVSDLVASHHGVPADHVLLTSGAAEAFLLIARALRPSEPLVIHPQFTEPEAALHAAGHRPRRHVLSPVDGFVLHPGRVSPTADLVMLGNPTNPTSVLHPAAAIQHLRRTGPPGRILVVDEAFMDAVPGERESSIGPDMRGLIVLRSLTKTWGLAGLRAGYAVGDPRLIALLGAQQPPWAVSTPALRAVTACLTPEAVALAGVEATRIGPDRDDLIARLTAIGAHVVEPAEAPFVLVDTSAWGPTSIRPALAARGFAVRRGETFPGLGPPWIRVAVRTPSVHAEFAAALAAIPQRLSAPSHGLST